MLAEGGIGMPGKPRWPFTMTEDQVACKTDYQASPPVNCMFVHEFAVSDVLQSSKPECPIVELMIMEDDGQGNVLSSIKIDPEHLRISTHDSTEGLYAKVEIDTSVAAEKLLSGQKLNYVLIAKTDRTEW